MQDTLYIEFQNPILSHSPFFKKKVQKKTGDQETLGVPKPMSGSSYLLLPSHVISCMSPVAEQFSLPLMKKENGPVIIIIIHLF